MASNAIAAYGTLIKRGASPTSPNQTFTTIAEVKSISGPSTKVTVLDVTTHSSAASGNYMEKLPSLIDPGEVTFDLNYVPSDATIQALRSDLTNRSKRQWKVQTPADATGASQNIVFDGYVTDFPLEFPTDDVMGGSITITITGAITFTP